MGSEVNIPKAFERAGVTIGRQRDTGDATILGEDFLDALVGAVEGYVAKEQGIARSATLITISVGTIIGLAGVRLLARRAEVNIQSASIKFVLMHFSLSLGCGGGISEFDVTKPIQISSSSEQVQNSLTLWHGQCRGL